MAALCRRCETGTVAAEHDLNDRTEPALPGGPVPEAIPLPTPQPGKESTKPDLVEPPPSGAKPALPDAPLPPGTTPLPKEPAMPGLAEPSPGVAKPASPDAPFPPEAIPLPKAQPGKEPTMPGLAEPSPSSPLPKKETEKGEVPAPPQGKEPAPINKTDYEQPSDEPKSWGFSP
ncbi:MAG: hypothetical protein ACLP9L_03605 [Thermoguttaceae bacterium]